MCNASFGSHLGCLPSADVMFADLMQVRSGVPTNEVERKRPTKSPTWWAFYVMVAAEGFEPPTKGL